MNKQEKKIFDVAERFMRSLSGKEILIRLLLAGGMFQEYLILVNFIGFLLMGFDKLMAIQEGGRIPEKTFFAVSAVGGPFGIILGMLVFHHKTRKTYFWSFTILMLVIYAFILIVSA